MKNWYVYIAVAPNARYYTGITTDPKRRMKQHNIGEGAKIARDWGNLNLVYVSAPFLSQSDARLREVQVKSWRKEKKQKLIAGIWT